jgi:anti-sigma-K factor RskA
MAEEYDIEKIERYLEEEMDAEELKAFEQRLDSDQGLQTEVAAYQQIFNGFRSLQSDTFLSQVQQWEEEWIAAEVDDSELAEWYVSGQLDEEGSVLVAARIKEDSAFAEVVQKQQTFHEGILSLKNEDFAAHIKSWEAEPPATARPKPSAGRILIMRRIAAAALFLLATIALYWTVSSQYSREAITQEMYEPLLPSGVMGEEQQEKSIFEQQLLAAHQKIQSEAYEAAFLSFDRLLSEVKESSLDDFNRQYYTEQAEWHRLLAAQSIQPAPLEIEKEARRIAASEGHSYQIQAENLLKKIDSFWYKLIN